MMNNNDLSVGPFFYVLPLASLFKSVFPEAIPSLRKRPRKIPPTLATSAFKLDGKFGVSIFTYTAKITQGYNVSRISRKIKKKSK